MKEFKGTKGKWGLSSETPNGIDSLKGNFAIQSNCNFAWDIACVFSDCDTLEISKANAKLIASAPEIFEMLKDAKAEFGEYHFMYNAIEQLLTKITE